MSGSQEVADGSGCYLKLLWHVCLTPCCCSGCVKTCVPELLNLRGGCCSDKLLFQPLVVQSWPRGLSIRAWTARLTARDCSVPTARQGNDDKKVILTCFLFHKSTTSWLMMPLEGLSCLLESTLHSQCWHHVPSNAHQLAFSHHLF